MTLIVEFSIHLAPVDLFAAQQRPVWYSFRQSRPGNQI